MDAKVTKLNIQNPGMSVLSKLLQEVLITTEKHIKICII